MTFELVQIRKGMQDLRPPEGDHFSQPTVTENGSHDFRFLASQSECMCSMRSLSTERGPSLQREKPLAILFDEQFARYRREGIVPVLGNGK